MTYSLNAGAWNSIFAVPVDIVDKYLRLADGASLKLLLFLLRHGGESFSEEQLMASTGIKSGGELEDAAMFWFQRGVIRMDEGELTPLDLGSQELLPEAAEDAERPEPSRAAVRKISRDSGAAIYTAGDIAKRIETDPSVKFLFDEAQQLYGRPLKNPESRTVLQITDFYGLPAEVAVMLLKYCFKVEKTSPSYIIAVAKDWAEENIRTVEEADSHLLKLEKRYGIEESLRRAMDMKTKFSPNQINFIRCWSEDWGFGEEMILLAHEITLDKTGGMSFSYTNKILENWMRAGVYTAEDAKKKSAEFSGGKQVKKPQGGNASLDMEKYMDELRRQYQT